MAWVAGDIVDVNSSRCGGDCRLGTHALHARPLPSKRQLTAPGWPTTGSVIRLRGSIGLYTEKNRSHKISMTVMLKMMKSADFEGSRYSGAPRRPTVSSTPKQPVTVDRVRIISFLFMYLFIYYARGQHIPHTITKTEKKRTKKTKCTQKARNYKNNHRAN